MQTKRTTNAVSWFLIQYNLPVLEVFLKTKELQQKNSQIAIFNIT